MQSKRKRLINLLLVIAVFYLVDFITKRYFLEYYIISWGIQNHYWYVWVIPAAFAVFNQPVTSALMTVGHPLGLFLGQYLGDIMKMRNLEKITSDMGNQEIYQLQQHMGVWIWLGTLLICMTAGIIITFVSKWAKKNRKNINGSYK